ncbi:MAG: hypothetical protein IBX44_02260 [Sulfurospirillum sp.]|nr:hypothetical protein [Sulfurospirillum sp.]
MISTLSKINKTLSASDKSSNIQFNAALPISITVLERLEMDRYTLLLGNRKFKTKSQKKLRSGAKYWGNFGESKDGIITISGLLEKPSLFQDGVHFLPFEYQEFMQKLIKQTDAMRVFKEWLIDNLADKNTDRANFMILSDMLLALQKNIFHLPLMGDSKPFLIQFQAYTNELEFYLAHENLGPLKGFLIQTKETSSLRLEVFFEKTLYFLQQEFDKINLQADLQIKKNISPLYDKNMLTLDLQC